MRNIEPVPIPPNHLLEHARVVGSRLDILPFLPKGRVFCEVGVAYGDFSIDVLNICQPKEFIAIDIFNLEIYPTMWGFERLAGGTHEDFYRRRFEGQINEGSLRMMKGYSTVELRKLPEKSVDVFYLDAWHSYESVREELEIIREKIADDGWILFNDYILYDFHTETEYGVIHAAHEFMIEHGWRLVFFALHPHMFCDIAIRKA